MKSFNLAILLISATGLIGGANTASAQDTPSDQAQAAGTPCGMSNAIGEVEASASGHDTVYDSLNGITNDAPMKKASRMGWKKRDASTSASCDGGKAVADAGPAHDSVYDSLNGITNEAPVNKAEHLGWKKRAVSNTGSSGGN